MLSSRLPVHFPEFSQAGNSRGPHEAAKATSTGLKNNPFILPNHFIFRSYLVITSRYGFGLMPLVHVAFIFLIAPEIEPNMPYVL